MTFKSKVVLKGLPPSITEEHLRQLLSEHTPHCRSVNFIPGRPPHPHQPLNRTHPASVILDFTSPDALLAFTDKWQSKEFKEGSKHYTASIHYFPLQFHFKYDSLQARRQAEASRGRLEELSSGYRQFLEDEFERPALDGPHMQGDAQSFLTAEKQSEVLREEEAKRKPWLKNPELLKKTPLLEHLGKMPGKEKKKALGGKSEDIKKGKKKKKGKKPENGSDLPDGFYIDTTPSAVNLTNAAPSSNYSTNRKPAAVDDLKIYDLSLEGKPADTKPRLKIAARPPGSAQPSGPQLVAAMPSTASAAQSKAKKFELKAIRRNSDPLQSDDPTASKENTDDREHMVAAKKEKGKDKDGSEKSKPIKSFSTKALKEQRESAK